MNWGNYEWVSIEKNWYKDVFDIGFYFYLWLILVNIFLVVWIVFLIFFLV